MIRGLRQFYLAAFALMLAINASFARANDLTLISNGRSRCQIVIASNAIPSERYAAEELQRYLEKISGAKLPITTDGAHRGAQEILLGDNAHLGKPGSKIDIEKLGAEGFTIRTEGQRLILAGGKPR